jgi:hypothetical protein
MLPNIGRMTNFAENWTMSKVGANWTMSNFAANWTTMKYRVAYSCHKSEGDTNYYQIVKAMKYHYQRGV